MQEMKTNETGAQRVDNTGIPLKKLIIYSQNNSMRGF